MRVLPSIAALALGVCCGCLAACGSGSSASLIPASQAGPLRDDFDRVAAAVAAHDCSAAADAVQSAQNDLNDISSQVDRRLRDRLQTAVTRLGEQAAVECQATATTVTTTDTSTDTTTTDTSTETTPTDTSTVTTPTTPTPDTTATTPTGGAPATTTTNPTPPQSDEPTGGAGEQ